MMKMSLIQWLGIAAAGLALWLLGETSIHVHQFGWFTGLLLLISMALVVLILITERSKEKEADE